MNYIVVTDDGLNAYFQAVSRRGENRKFERVSMDAVAGLWHEAGTA